MIRPGIILAACLFMAFTACQRPERPEPQWEISSLQLQIQGREQLIFVLPENFQREFPVISSKPSNAAVAEIFRNENGLQALRYQSANGRQGTDQLSIDSEDEKAEHEDKCGGHGHPGPFGHPRRHGEKHGHHRLNIEIKVLETEIQAQKNASAARAF